MIALTTTALVDAVSTMLLLTAKMGEKAHYILKAIHPFFALL